MSKEFRIGIICGHGDGDPGAVSKTYGNEADLVRKLAPKLKVELEKYEGVVVEILNTSRNHYQYLKSHNIDFSKYNYVIELHANAGAKDPNGNGATTGIEIWVTPREKGISVEQEICKQLASLGLKNRGVKKSNFYVINCVKNDGVSACLIENGFIDDKDDMEIITKKMNEYASKLALGVANGFGFKKGAVKPSKPAKPSMPAKKSVTEVAKDVISGKYGNGNARKKKLESEGYNYNEVQTMVDKLLGASSVKPKKSITQVAKDVIAGKYGNGATRKKKLEAEGYNYKEVQKKVNELL